MYSLYRAWLMRDAFTSSINSPPDVVLQVGPTGTHFAAHRAVLASHSGYFKSVLSAPTTSPVIVSNVGVSEFTTLLTWMYTGFIDLNVDNIYNVLLATHILHMPSALEICRNFLLQQNHLENRMIYPNHNIIKPIPSRKVIPDSFHFEPIIRTQQPNFLSDLERTSFQKVDNVTVEASKESPGKIIDIEKVLSPKPSTSHQRSPVRIQSESPNLSDSSEAVVQYSQPSKKSESKKKRSSSNSREIPKNTINNEQVIIDIACCDGPVRFHRVLNNCYGITNVVERVETETRNRTDIMNRIMTENINRDENLKKSANLEKKVTRSDETSRNGSEKSENDIVYTCVYCNHTFKSQYCYQKHARRHINPVTLDSTCKADVKSNDTKREVKLLDMNVQYYPCKTCGSKFPSYYFVHKHRKMYHAEEMAAEKESCGPEEASGKSNMDVIVTVDAEENNTGGPSG